MPQSASSRHQLLLLLGEAVLTDLTAFRLELLGYSVIVAHDAEEAIQQIDDQRPGLLLLNSSIGDFDGLTWLAKLRSRISPDELPTLIVSLDPSLDTVRRSFEAGAQDYIISPFDPTVLEQKVSRFVDAEVFALANERTLGKATLKSSTAYQSAAREEGP